MSDSSGNVQISSLAATYARSLFKLAEQSGQVEAVHEQLGELVELLEEHPALKQVFAHKAIEPARRAATIERIFEGRADDLVVRFLLVLNDQQRLSELPVIHLAYDKALKASRNQVDVTVTTAQPLDEEQRDAVVDRLTRALGREAIVHTRTAPALIGGLRITYEDKLIDASVASQLRRMSQHVAARGHEAIRSAAGRLLADVENGELTHAQIENEADVG